MKKFIKMLCQVLNDYCTVLFVRKPLVAANIGVGVFTMVTNNTEWVLIEKNIKEKCFFNTPFE